MAIQVNTIKGIQLKVKMGDGASPESFVPWCIINTERGIQWTSAGTSEPVPYCDEPDLVSWTQHTKTSLTGNINGAGKLDVDSIDNVWPWYNSDDAKNLQIEVGTKGYWQGAWKLTDFGATGNDTGKADGSIAMVSDGPQEWIANS